MKSRDIIFLSLFSVIILFFGIGILVLPRQSFSQKENRILTTAATLSFESLLSGEYFEQISELCSDQFPMRDGFTAIYALSELSLGKSEVNGVVFSGNVLAARSKNMKSSSDALRKAKELFGEDSYVYIPPSSIQVFSQLLPQSLQSEIASQPSAFLPSDYYKTDHHWTTEGAYIAYTKICGEFGISAFGEEYFEKETVAKDFRGSAYARSCLPDQLISPDKITLYRYEGDEDVEIFRRDTSTQEFGFYDESALLGADKYRVFLGGNYAQLSIKSDQSKPRLVLVKDSFANSVIPFLSLHFNIEVIDPRYCTQSELLDLADEYSSERILILMSEATLIECFN